METFGSALWAAFISYVAEAIHSFDTFTRITTRTVLVAAAWYLFTKTVTVSFGLAHLARA
jgi:hypothetical protein